MSSKTLGALIAVAACFLPQISAFIPLTPAIQSPLLGSRSSTGRSTHVQPLPSTTTSSPASVEKATKMDPEKIDSPTEDFFGNYAYPANRPRWKKKTKQVATLGPASSSLEMIEKLFIAGADVFRLNFSHGAHAEKAKILEYIRQVETKYRHPICILADLQGPKLRVGMFDNDKVTIVEGQTFRFDMDPELGDACRVQLPHPEIINTLRPSDVLLLDDGKLKMTVTKTGEGWVECFVNVGGSLSNRKGVNTPTVTLPISPLTPKDRADLDFALSIGVDVVALSFVQKAEDIEEIQAIIKERAKVLAKIEKPQAMDNLEQIVELSDMIMVARGDLGVEMNIEDVPIAQKRIISLCRSKGKPVVVATQMLESMIDNPTPTRAEASDVATAIYDGADAIMLSAESAAGKWPVESVTMQQRIITRVENDPNFQKMNQAASPSLQKKSATDSITLAAKNIAQSLDAAAIVTFSARGTTTLRASKLRPAVPVIGITPNIETARSLALAWGVYPAVVQNELAPGDTVQNFRTMLTKSCSVARRKRIAEEPTDLLVVTAGLPFGTPGIANILRILPAAGPDVWDPTLTSDMDTEESYVNYDLEV